VRKRNVEHPSNRAVNRETPPLTITITITITIADTATIT